MTGWLIFISSVLTSSVMAAAISSHLVEEKERWVFRRSKIEDIYMSSAGWLKEVGILLLHYLHVCEGSITFNQMIDLQISHSDRSAVIGEYHLKMTMNIKMYEPSLIPHFEDIDKELKVINKLQNAIKSCYEETNQASEFKEYYKQQVLIFYNAEEKLKDAIIRRGLKKVQKKVR